MVFLINPDSIAFIDKFGFPIFVSTVVLGMVIMMVRRDAVRQDKGEARFDTLVNKLFESITTLSNKNEAAAKEANKELRNIAVILESITVKIDTYGRIIENELQAKNQSLIFKNETEIKEKKFE